MTKYILAGGSDRKFDDYGTRLALEVHKEVINPTILSCFFSNEKDTWKDKFESWRGWFKEYFGSDVNCELASPSLFLGQVERADIVYLHGGRTQRLMEVLPDFQRVRKAFDRKIVIGSSAGANYLAKTGYSPSVDKFFRGSGIVAANVIVHYGAETYEGNEGDPKVAADWLEIRKRFESYVGPNEVVTTLREGEFLVFEQ